MIWDYCIPYPHHQNAAPTARNLVCVLELRSVAHFLLSHTYVCFCPVGLSSADKKMEVLAARKTQPARNSLKASTSRFLACFGGTTLKGWNQDYGLYASVTGWSCSEIVASAAPLSSPYLKIASSLVHCHVLFVCLLLQWYICSCTSRNMHTLTQW